MLSGTAAKRLLIVVGVTLVALLAVGFAFGAIGSAILGTPQILHQPHISLPPEPVFPPSVRDHHLGLTGDAADADHHSTPLGITDFAITNTMLSAWFASIVIILFFVAGSGKKSLIPGRFQSLIETLYEAIISFASAVLGPEMARRTFPVVATIFFFVLFNAWLALLPFYHFIGFIVSGESELAIHLVRPAGTDLNMPLALALVSFFFVEYWGIRAHGLGYLKKFFAFGSIFSKGLFRGVIDLFVGFLELVSEFIRIVSFTFRLFGNMTAGEILVVMITFLVPLVISNLVYGLELLIGLIQAVIFAGLTLVFLSVAVRHEEH